MEHITNSSATESYSFSLQTVATRLHFSSTKFVSASYTTYTESDLSGMSLSVSMNASVSGQYISTTQTIGSAVQYKDLSSASYAISNEIPANTVVKVTCKETSAGGYGMALCDTSGNVLAYFTHTAAAATDDVYTFAVQTVPTKLYVSVNKFVSATYTYQ